MITVAILWIDKGRLCLALMVDDDGLRYTLFVFNITIDDDDRAPKSLADFQNDGVINRK